MVKAWLNNIHNIIDYHVKYYDTKNNTNLYSVK